MALVSTGSKAVYSAPLAGSVLSTGAACPERVSVDSGIVHPELPGRFAPAPGAGMVRWGACE